MCPPHTRQLKTDEGFLEAAVGVLLLLSRYPEGAEALLVNGVAQPLCISLADALMVKLEAARQEKQVGHPSLPPSPIDASSILLIYHSIVRQSLLTAIIM